MSASSAGTVVVGYKIELLVNLVDVSSADVGNYGMVYWGP